MWSPSDKGRITWTCIQLSILIPLPLLYVCKPYTSMCGHSELAYKEST